MGIVRVLNQFLVCNIAFVLVDALFINFEVPSTICRIEEEKDFILASEGVPNGKGLAIRPFEKTKLIFFSKYIIEINIFYFRAK